MKNIIVKINDAVQTVQEVAVVTNDGQPTVIKGVKNVNYQLVDQATGRGPDHIVTKRVGKDLHISLEDAGEETDLIIEGFYEDDRSALIGQAEDGQYYYYIPDTGEVADYVTQLQAGDVEGQALGGSPYATPWWIGATDTGFGYLPWILGLIGVGALAAALANDDDDNNSSATPAKTGTPTVVVTHKDTSKDGVDDVTNISGKTEPNAAVAITLPNGQTVNTTADKDGNYSVDVPLLKEGDKVTVVATAPNKDASDKATGTAPAVDTTPTDTTIPGDSNGDGKVDGDDDSKNYVKLPNGETVPRNTNGAPNIVFGEDTNPKDGKLNGAEIGPDNSTPVYVTIPDGTEVGDTLTVTIDGNPVTIPPLSKDDISNGYVTLPPVSTVGKDGKDITVSAQVTDPAGNSSAKATETVSVDTTPPKATAQLDPNSDTGTKGDNITNDTTPTISGTGEPGDTIKVTTPTGEVLEVVVGEDKKWSVTPKQPLPEGENEITVEAKDPAGNTSTVPPVTVTVDTTPPDVETTRNPDDSVTVVTEPNTPIVDKDGNPITDENDKPIVSDDEGKATIPADQVPPDNVIGAKDDAGNTSTTKADPADTTIPGDSNGDGKVDGDDDSKNYVKLPNGETVPRNTDGAPNIVFGEDTNKDGKLNGDEIGPDNSTPVYVTIPDGTQPGDTLTVTIDGNPVTIPPLSKDDISNGYVTLPPVSTVGKDGKDITVSAQVTDPAGNSSEKATETVSVDITPPTNTTAQLDPNSDTGTVGDNITSDTTPTISGTGEPDDTIKVTTPTGEVLEAVVGEDGKWSVTPTQPLPEGENEITVEAKDPAGNTSTVPPVTVTVDTTPPAVETTRNPDDSVTVKTEPNKPIVDKDGNPITDENGEPIVSDDKGKATVPANKVPADDVIGAKDDAGNTGTAKADPADTTIPGDSNGDGKVDGDDDSKNYVKLPNGETVPRNTDGAPNIVFGEDTNKDGKLNGDEIGPDNSTPVYVTIPDGTQPGDTLTVTIDGNPVTIPPLSKDDISNGYVTLPPVSTVGKDGKDITVSAQVTDPAGNSSEKATETVSVDITPPTNTTAQLDPNSDTGTVGDNITSDTTPTISGTGEPGDTIKVTTPTGEVLEVVVDEDGNWSVTPTQPLPEGENEITVEAKDPAGNTSTVPSVTVTVDTTPPDVETTRNPDDSVSVVTEPNTPITDKDGNPIKDENGNPIVSDDEGKATIPAEQVPTDNVIGAKDPAGNTGTTTADPADNTIPGDSNGDGKADGDDDSKNYVKLPNGETVPRNTDGAPNIVFGEDTNKDGKLNGDEIGPDNSTPVYVTIPDGTQPGDTLTVTIDGNPVTIPPLSKDDISNGYVTLPPVSTVGKDGKDITVSAQVTDPAGNSSEKATETVSVDITAPSAPGAVKIGNGDDFITKDEIDANGNVTVNVDLPEDAKPGDKVTVNGVEKTLNDDDIKNGNVDVKVPAPNEGEKLDVTATITDEAGNTGEPATDSATRDTTVGANNNIYITAISEDTGISNKDYITSDNTLTVSGTLEAPLPEGEGEKVQVSLDSGKTWINAVTTDATWTADATGTELADGEHTIIARIVDDAGNVGPKDQQAVTIDTTKPGDADANDTVDPAEAPQVEIGNGDKVIDAADNPVTADGKTTVIATVTFPNDEYKVGDSVKITDQEGRVLLDRPLTQQDLDDGIKVPVTPAPEGQTTTVTATVTDPAGNTSSGFADAVTDLVTVLAELTSITLVDQFNESKDDLDAGVTTAWGVTGTYTGVISSSDLSKTAINTENRTNDTTPTVELLLTSSLESNQVLRVTRTDRHGNSIELDATKFTAEAQADGTYKYTYTEETALDGGLGEEYTYAAVIETDNTAGTVQTTSMILDTVAEAPTVSSYDRTTNELVMLSREKDATIFVDVNKNGVLDNGEDSVSNGTLVTTGVNAGMYEYKLNLGSNQPPSDNRNTLDTYTPIGMVDAVGNKADSSQAYIFDLGEMLSVRTLSYQDQPADSANGTQFINVDFLKQNTNYWNNAHSDAIVMGHTYNNNQLVTDGSQIYTASNLTESNNQSQLFLSTRAVSPAGNRFDVFFGGGDDTMRVGGNMDTGTGVYMGSGNDQMSVEGGFNRLNLLLTDMYNPNAWWETVRIDMGAGDDIFTSNFDGIGYSIFRGLITMGEGDDIIKVGHKGITNSLIFTDEFAYDGVEGVGDVALGNITGNLDPTKVLESGVAGNDIMDIATLDDGAYVFMGAGQDILTTSGSVSGNAQVYMGSGNDKVTIGSEVKDSSRINLGDGDDVISIARFGGSTNYSIDGGEGIDVLNLTGSNINGTSSATNDLQIKNIEVVNLTGNDAHINIALQHLQLEGDTLNVVYINNADGVTGNVIDLGDNTDYTAKNLGNFVQSQVGVSATDPAGNERIYDVYTNDGETLYIDQAITVI